MRSSQMPHAQVFGGWLVGAFSLYLGFHIGGALSTAAPIQERTLCHLVVVAFVLLACFLVWEAASMSAHCSWLTNTINDLCLEDPAATHRLNFLRALKSLNSDQGLGFKAGTRIDRLLLIRIAGAVITGVFGVLPLLIHDSQDAACSAGASGQHAACPFGWTFASGSCFILYGEPMNEMYPALSRGDAEDACQRVHDGNLASINGQEQQDVVATLARDVGSAWIGLKATSSPDDSDIRPWEWSDGEPYDAACCGEDRSDWDMFVVEEQRWSACCTFNYWHPMSPVGDQRGVIVGRHQDASSGIASWDNYDESNRAPYICAKKATPRASHSRPVQCCLSSA